MTNTLPFYWVDAFTDQLFGGNPCAVVLDADRLSEQQMQQLALEMGLSETAFVMNSTQGDFAARYFTPGGEIPLAGHPTISCVSVLLATGRLTAGESISLELPAGLIKVSTTADELPLIIMEQCPPTFMAIHDKREIASLLGLTEDDLIANVPIQTVSTGTPQLMVAVKDVACVEKAAIDIASYRRYRDSSDHSSVHVFCPSGYSAEGATFARHFSVPPDPIEDPFTGSATGGMAAFAVKYGLVTQRSFIAEQGHGLGRPGKAWVDVLGDNEAIEMVTVGGKAVILVEGQLRRP